MSKSQCQAALPAPMTCVPLANACGKSKNQGGSRAKVLKRACSVLCFCATSGKQLTNQPIRSTQPAEAVLQKKSMGPSSGGFFAFLFTKRAPTRENCFKDVESHPHLACRLQDIMSDLHVSQIETWKTVDSPKLRTANPPSSPFLVIQLTQQQRVGDFKAATALSNNHSFARGIVLRVR